MVCYREATARQFVQEATQKETGGSEALTGSDHDRAGHGLEKTTAPPAAEGLLRPERHIKPPKRLIQSFWALCGFL